MKLNILYLKDISNVQSSRDGIRTVKPLRVKVITAETPREYTNSNNKKMVVVEAVIADASGYKKCSCYNRIAFPFIKENNSIMLLNVISKTNDIVATRDSKIIMIPDVAVPTEVVTTAKTETCKVYTTTTILKIEELLDQKEGTVFNVIGKVIEVILMFLKMVSLISMRFRHLFHTLYTGIEVKN